MQKVLVITLKGDVKYHFGIDKSVQKVQQEIEQCNKDFYQVLDSCSLKISEIISIETAEYDPGEVVKDDKA